jgi:Carboxypeptidase regulatory-like domain/TonB-dependent Receptor Plug Domain
MKLQNSFRYLLVVALFLASVTGLYAQISGDIEIKTVDPSGAAIGAAKVTVRNLETGTMRTATTASDGSVRVTLLNVGKYEVKVEAAGFATLTLPVDVNSGRVSDFRAALELQTTRQEVVVSEQAELLNTSNAQLQQVVTTRDITELPVNTNTAGILTFAATAPGVVPQTPNNNNGFLGFGNFSSNGGRTRGANITIDNATATDVSTTGAAGLTTFPIDAVQEVSFITNNFNAEYGRNSSAQFQIVTKSGGNDFHGRLFEFFRNDKLNARSFFDQTGHPDITRNNDWGAVVGGRIIKDRLFWLGTYEEVKVRGAGAAVIATVPTPGDVAGITNATSRALFASLGGVTSPSGTISNSAANTTDSRALSGRLDFNLTQKDNMFVRGGVADTTSTSGLAFISSNLVGNGAVDVNREANITLSETHSFSPRLINNFLASYGRSSPNFTPTSKNVGPFVGFNDGTDGLGPWSGIPQGRTQNTFQYLDTVTYNIGAHTLKAGYELNRIQSNGAFDSNVRGTYIFNSFQDFQTGNPFSYQQRFGNSVRGYRVWNNFGFIQDDWRATRNLTLNLGMRLEVSNGATEVNGLLSNLNLRSTATMGGAGSGPLGAIEAVPVSNAQQHNWGPRFGFAYNPHGGKTVVRGGYGIAYDFSFLNPVTNLRFAPPFMYQFATTDFSGANSFANMVAGTSPFIQSGFATVGNFGTTIRSFGSLGPVDQGLRNPQVQQWNLTVERTVWNGVLIRAGYVGTKGNYLQRSEPINTLRPGAFTPPNTLAEEAALAANGTIKAVNAALSAPPTGTTNRIDPRFQAVTLLDSGANSNYHSFQFQAVRRFSKGLSFSAAYTWSKSIDNSSDALNVLLNEPAVAQNPFNNRDNRGVSAFDVPHRFVLSHVYEIPGFKNSNAFLKQTLSGWEFSGIYVAQSGTPVNLSAGAKRGVTDALLLGTAAGSQRPDLIGPLNVSFTPNPSGDGAPANKVTNSGLAQPLVGHFGTLGRNVLRINGLNNFDWTLGKKFPIRERVNIELQAQAFNVFNHTSFALLSPNARNIATPQVFGYYDGTQSESRNIQINLRLIW